MENGDAELRLGGLSIQRDFVDVRDVARAVRAASRSTAQGVINIGSGGTVRLRDIAVGLAGIAGFGGTVREAPGASIAAPPYPDGCGIWQQADVHAAREQLGWQAQIPLEDSLADIWMETACREPLPVQAGADQNNRCRLLSGHAPRRGT